MTNFDQLLEESRAKPFLKFYQAARYGIDPDPAIVFDCLLILKVYYIDYLHWYKNVCDPKMFKKEVRVYNDFSKRLDQINIALDSDSLKRQIIAVDDGINQWHIDYPVIAHLEMEDEDEERSMNEWGDVVDILRALGKLAPETPYQDERETRFD